MGYVKGMLRYGSGGPYQLGSRKGPMIIGKTTIGDGISNYRKDRYSSFGAIQSQFRLDWDARDLQNALNSVGADGDKFVSNLLKEEIRMAISEVRENFREMAGGLRGERLPDGTKTLYDKLADSLRFDQVPGDVAYRIHMGDNLNRAELGLVGSRGGFLSKNIAEGVSPFEYSQNLPFFVKSSVSFFKDTGQISASSRGMEKEGLHPGFPQYDYMLDIEEYVVENFEKDAIHFAEAWAARYGFSL